MEGGRGVVLDRIAPIWGGILGFEGPCGIIIPKRATHPRSLDVHGNGRIAIQLQIPGVLGTCDVFDILAHHGVYVCI